MALWSREQCTSVIPALSDDPDERMFDIIFSKLLEDQLLRLPVQREYKDITVMVTPCVPGTDDPATLSYHLDLLLEIFRFGNQNLRAVIADDKAVLDPSRLELLEKSMFFQLRSSQSDGLTSTDMTYAVLLVRICLRYVPDNDLSNHLVHSSSNSQR